ncbi:VOC family protein [Ruania alkalisoli]|uniref:VOC family protein n=1 Tax=Ruania alkalisoli TaxID=2779775 RepID=A0A7M1SUL4_9MICO|nr:VOC family protein [Ruania alkalisoli]QOR70624.1 VOC family protein [Ruania alkalisoli]
MTLTMAMVTVDSTDPGPLAAWWAEQLGGSIVEENDGWFYVVESPKLLMAFQKVDDPTPGKNRVHLDLLAPDLDAEVERLKKAGAEPVDEHAMGDFRWVILADPQQNVFCVAAAGSH